ncbi:MAG TPA: LPP20 family lipoprotein [Treponemataceae bacterium]|nr:LPP20 family lipoprotein [Treponemataceae bacterium]
MCKMKKSFVSIGLFCAFVFLYNSCVTNTHLDGSSKTAPEWVINVNTVYPNSDWLAAVGYANDRVSAENQAVAQLGKSIKQRVEAETIARQTLESAGAERVNLQKQTQLISAYSASITTQSVLDEIAGIRIKEVWTASDRTVYAVAAVNRDEAGRYYAEKIAQYESAINSEILYAINHEATFDAVNSMIHAATLAQETEPFIDILSVVHPSLYKKIDLSYQSAQAVEVLAQREVQKIVVGVYVAGDVSGRIAQAFANQIAQAGFKSKLLSDFSESTIAEQNIPYCVKTQVSFHEVDMSANAKYEFVRFVVESELFNVNTGQVVLPYTINGREAHNTVSEARQRGVRSIEEKIASEYNNLFLDLLKAK